MPIAVAGISHHTAPIEIREQLALPGCLSDDLLKAVRDEGVCSEALVLHTCNRTELYLVFEGCLDCIDYLLEHLERLRQQPLTVDRSFFYYHSGLDAVRHLFRVAASLDSQVVGETQIIRQVKNAYRQALEARTARFILNKLLHRAMSVSKQVRTQTSLSQGAASVPYAAVELARTTLGDLSGRSVLLIGAGKTAELAARNLAGAGITRITVANRSVENARRVVDELLRCDNRPVPFHERHRKPQRTHEQESASEIKAIGLDDLPAAVTEADLIITSTGAPDYVLRYDALAETLANSRRQAVIIDIAVPRDADPKLAEISGVSLYDMNDLNRVVEIGLESRRSEIPKAEAIIEHEVQQFDQWLQSRQMDPTIKLLQQYFKEHSRAVLQRYGDQICDEDDKRLELFTNSLCKKILNAPMEYLQSLSRESTDFEHLAAADVVRKMFSLDDFEK